MANANLAHCAVRTDRPVPKPMTPAARRAHDAASYVRPSRRLVAAGVKRGAGPLIVEQSPPVDFASVR